MRPVNGWYEICSKACDSTNESSPSSLFSVSKQLSLSLPPHTRPQVYTKRSQYKLYSPYLCVSRKPSCTGHCNTDNHFKSTFIAQERLLTRMIEPDNASIRKNAIEILFFVLQDAISNNWRRVLGTRSCSDSNTKTEDDIRLLAQRVFCTLFVPYLFLD